MTFSARLKEEISKTEVNPLEIRCELAAFLRYTMRYEKNRISILIENASIARRIYKEIKVIYNVEIKIIVRNQKRFKIEQLFILEIKDKVNYILKDLNIKKDKKKMIIPHYVLEAKEEKISFLRGLFLSCGSINDPATSGYHLEFNVHANSEALFIKKVLAELNLIFKIIKRNNNYMLYIKESEKISDIIKMFRATNSLFYFEDIRIYRDHKNMVNRLNNCEIANQEKVLNTSMKQILIINYLKENDLLSLLDEKTQIVIEYRLKYQDVSYNELAEIISLETDYRITKSGINHHFIKIKELYNRHQRIK